MTPDIVERIDDGVLHEAIQHAPADLALVLSVARANLRRAQGDFAGALGDLELARTLGNGNSTSPQAIAYMHQTSVKVEIDLGRFERAIHELREMQAVSSTFGSSARARARARATRNGKVSTLLLSLIHI